MNGVTHSNLSSQSTKASSTVALSIVFTHPVNKDETQAEAYVVDALTDYAKAVGLDIYTRDQDDNQTTTVDEDLLIPAIQTFLRDQMFAVIVRRRADVAEASARTTAQQTLLGAD